MVQERTLAYKEQQRLIALADRETADDRANDAARELETTEVPPPPWESVSSTEKSTG